MKAAAVLFLLAGGLGAFAVTSKGKSVTASLVSSFRQWASVKTEEPAAEPAPDEQEELVDPSAPAALTGPKLPDGVTAQTSHFEIVQKLLTPRTVSLFSIDLKQVIPFYNLMASRTSMPPQREMSDAFRRHYGVDMEPFDRVSVLQGAGKDEFILVLSSPELLDIEKITGQRPISERPANVKGIPHVASTDGPQTRMISLRAGSRVFTVSQYDGFTLLLGEGKWVEFALKQTEGNLVRLREALCMYPETALRDPGALILVERLSGLPGAPKPPDGEVEPFETVISNLFLDGSAKKSSLILTRNPNSPAESFIEAAPPALRTQVATLAGSDAKKPATAPDDVTVTVSEASVRVSGGEKLISSAVESVARTFMQHSPSIDLILKAQDAVTKFNAARSVGSDAAMGAASATEALTLLREGLRGGGRFGGAVFQMESIDSGEIDTMAHLVSLEDNVGLVYRPDSDYLSGETLDLAIKARDYRNAELLVILWKEGKLAATNEDPGMAARQVLTWATSTDGKSRRILFGLPSLTSEELAGSLAHLTVKKSELVWKPGEKTYREWVRAATNDPARLAARLAATWAQAAAAGAFEKSRVSDLSAAVAAIVKGVSGSGSNAGKTFQCEGADPADVKKASALLTFEDGKLKLSGK